MGNPEPGCYCESCNALRVNAILTIQPPRGIYDRARYYSLKARNRCVVCAKAFAQRGTRCAVCAEANHAAVERCKKANRRKKNLDSRQVGVYIALSSGGSEQPKEAICKKI